jgi:hypothetical protein
LLKAEEEFAFGGTSTQTRAVSTAMAATLAPTLCKTGARRAQRRNC